MTIRIRKATLADIDTVCDFNRLLAKESEGKDLDLSLLRPGVTAVLGDPHKGRYFIAEDDGLIVGQLAITYEWSDWRNTWFWWIQSVYVIPDGRRRGVFRSLYAFVEETAQSEGNVNGIRLYVERENQAAHATYQKLGLDWAGYLVMEKYPLVKRTS
jgi:GNAT superfamily N-acetyltransferase